ncbi:MAG TPA: transcription termination factor Rho [Chthoniobacteraceae bacterium]|jgi:transcription termination factor Rho|nr:transcription termination factor Rho [Chthoniobacteraceae bacterium]
MTEPTEGQPTLAEPKKTTRRKSASPRAGGKTRRTKAAATTDELPLEVTAAEQAPKVATAPSAPKAAAPAPVAEPEPQPAPAPAPVSRQQAPASHDADQIEDAAQILSRITSAPLSPAETEREANRVNNPRPPQQRQERFERPYRQERQDRYDRGDRGDRGGDRDRGDRDPRGDRAEYEEGSATGNAEAPDRESEPKHEPIFAEGIVEVSGKGFGFLRDPKRNFIQSPTDVFVTPEVVRRFALRDGHWIKGEVRRGSRGLQMFRLTAINGDEPTDYGNFPLFEELTVISPVERFKLETVTERYTTRVMDLMTPIGKGQRGIIVAPPRTGKTTLLQHIADAIVKNHPETILIILLVDERPEEVTEIRRTVPSAEIMASSNDMDIKSHTRIAQLAIERAKRLVEAGKDVFVLLDSITRVGRAFNNAMGGGGRTMSGGIDARALEIPRKLFAAARNTEEAGSLTIIATALIETGSRMDELIFQEFKGTGNMEMVLDRKISDLRVYPAIDIFKSGTRREELLVPADQLHKINVIRRGLAGHKPEEAVERLLSFLRKFPTNYQMLKEIPG